MTFEEIIGKLKESLGKDWLISEDRESKQPSVQVAVDKVLDLSKVLFEHDQLYFDYLSCITGIDNGPEKNTMEVIYNFYSIPFNHHLTVKVEVPREKPEVSSLSGIWKTANWHEREAYDLFGIKFSGHPNLRRILLPADWEGHPLQKDYQEQEKYHGITVKY